MKIKFVWKYMGIISVELKLEFTCAPKQTKKCVTQNLHHIFFGGGGREKLNIIVSGVWFKYVFIIIAFVQREYNQEAQSEKQEKFELWEACVLVSRKIV